VEDPAAKPIAGDTYFAVDTTSYAVYNSFENGTWFKLGGQFTGSHGLITNFVSWQRHDGMPSGLFADCHVLSRRAPWTP